MKAIIKALPTILIVLIIFCGCEKSEGIPGVPLEIEGLVFSERVPNKYAHQFAIDRYEDGYSVIRTMGEENFLIVPEGKNVPENVGENIIVLNQPIENIYLAATSAMGLFSELDCGSMIKFSGTKTDDWYIDYAKNAMENGDMLYAGKYREPDYELLLSEKCGLTIESTMIGHSPEVKDKLIELGIPVFIDYSSYESHPLGRSEWIKVYGEMCGKQDEADRLFGEQSAQLEAIRNADSTGKTVVFFYINTSGQAVTRKSGDYVTKMIELAGGKNVFDDIGDPDTAASSVVMEMEKFYRQSKDADIIIYNSTIGGEINTIDELIGKNDLLADFKAVQSGNVWCTRANLFQETMKLGTVISDLNSIFTDSTENTPPVFLYNIERESGND